MRAAELELTKDDITTILEWADIVEMNTGLSDRERAICRLLELKRDTTISPESCLSCGYDKKSEWHRLVCYSTS